MLLRIENKNSKFELHNASIEHVLPQESTEYWKGQIAVNENENLDEVIDYLTNSIGNLTILDIQRNASAKHYDFKTKYDLKEIEAKSK